MSDFDKPSDDEILENDLSERQDYDDEEVEEMQAKKKAAKARTLRTKFVNKKKREDIEEAAADTLKPGAGSGGGETRAEMLATFTSLLAQLGKEDLSDLFNRTLAQIGHEADAIPPNAAAKNAATIQVKEDIEEMFSGDDLSEEFREKASVIFEAALNTRINLEVAKLEEEFEEATVALQEEFEQALEEELESSITDISEKLDLYLDYVIEQWMEENTIAVESALRTEIAEDFISNLHNLFTEHHIKVPESKVDLVSEMKSEIDSLKEALNSTLDEKIALQNIIEEASKEATLDEVAEGLAATQAEKLRTLSEGIEYVDETSYRRKLEIVKENYFGPRKAAASTGFITESIDGEDTDVSNTPAVPAEMSKYVAAISKSVK